MSIDITMEELELAIGAKFLAPKVHAALTSGSMLGSAQHAKYGLSGVKDLAALTRTQRLAKVNTLTKKGGVLRKTKKFLGLSLSLNEIKDPTKNPLLADAISRNK